MFFVVKNPGATHGAQKYFLSINFHIFFISQLRTSLKQFSSTYCINPIVSINVKAADYGSQGCRSTPISLLDLFSSFIFEQTCLHYSSISMNKKSRYSQNFPFFRSFVFRTSSFSYLLVVDTLAFSFSFRSFESFSNKFQVSLAKKRKSHLLNATS